MRAPGGIAATIVGFDPENQNRIVTIDRGSGAGVEMESGVVSGDGVVGRVIEVDPFQQ